MSIEEIKIEDILEIKYGDSLPDRLRLGGEVPVFGSNGIVGYHNKSITIGKTIIIGRKGSAGELNWCDVPCFPIDTTYFVDELKLDFLLEYIFFQLKNLKLTELHKSSAVPGLNRDDVYKIKLRIETDKSKQIRVVERLQSQLARVEAMRQAALKQKEAAKALQSAILREVFPWRAGESLPSGWRWEKITDISKNLDGKRIPVTEKIRQKGDVPYYGASGIVDYVKNYLFNEDLLLVSEDGANLVMRTYPIAFSISGKTWVNNHAHVLKFEDKDTQKITEHYINGLDISDFISGAAQPKLNQDNLNRIKIPIPVEPHIRSGIVKRIENEFEVGRRIEKQVEVQLAAIEALPAAILREAFAFQTSEV